MSEIKKLSILIAGMLSICFFPWLGSFWHNNWHFPEGFFAYPPLSAMHKDSLFNLPIFIFVAFACTLITTLYIFPSWFGFKKNSRSNILKPTNLPLPYWFWIGFLAWGISLFFLAIHAKSPAWFIHWSDLPLFWGFTLMLDGLVYKRNNGKSLMSQIPQELIGIGIASISGWMIFEFLNFFIDDNWYYPWGNILDREEFLLYACIISSGLLPLSFEWYCLFKTMPSLSEKYNFGPKIVLNNTLKGLALIIGIAGIFASGVFPMHLFFALWVFPPVILTVVLDFIGVWTPIKPIGQGNWSPALLSALTYFVTGFCLEGQNYLSAIHDGQQALFTNDPAYWQYSIPFVNVWHVFEMPFFGFYGYLPFGIYCWLWWIAFATLLNIPAKFLKENPLT
jgi:hypothetical protein